jgi:hypothetical protein
MHPGHDVRVAPAPARARSTARPVLILAHPADWAVARFTAYAQGIGLPVWQPRTLEEIGWSFVIDGDRRLVRLDDLAGGRSWTVAGLGGLWYQSMPPLAPAQHLDEADRTYAAVEFNNATWALWSEAACPIMGLPPTHCPPHVFDFGIEARVTLRQLGLPVLSDRVGTLEHIRDELRQVPAGRVRITRAGRYSTVWLADALSGPLPPGEPPLEPAELLAATVADEGSLRVVMHFDGEIFGVDAGRDRGPIPIRPDERAPLAALVDRVRDVAHTRFGIVYACREQGRWVVARLALQVPFWLVNLCEGWLFPRLAGAFTADPPRTSPP